MDARNWRRICRTLGEESRNHLSRHKHFPDAVIVRVCLWAVMHDRPTNWACEPAHWRGYRRPCLPSQPTMSRRLRTVGVAQLMEQVGAGLREQLPRRAMKIIDSRPLLVGGASKDRDAKPGRAVGGQARGYRLHMIWDADGSPDQWQLAPMCTNDKVPALTLIPLLSAPTFYLLGDNQYDANRLYDLAAEGQTQLLVMPRSKVPAGLGHRPQSPHRLRGLDLASHPLAVCGVDRSFGQELLDERGTVERGFGAWASAGGGLGCYLPAWVRRPHRVALWVAGKIILLLSRQIENRQRARRSAQTSTEPLGVPPPRLALPLLN